jgi:hypothetical protein
MVVNVSAAACMAAIMKSYYAGSSLIEAELMQ